MRPDLPPDIDLARATDPSGRFCMVADERGDRLLVFRSTGGVKPRVVAQRPGSGPIQIVFHPTIPVVYTCNAGNSTITAHHWDGAAGALAYAQSLRAIPAAFTGANRILGIAISPDGRYLYAVHRGHNSLAVFAIQRGKGKMFLRAREVLSAAPPGPPVLNVAGTMMMLGDDGAEAMRFVVQPANGMVTAVLGD